MAHDGGSGSCTTRETTQRGDDVRNGLARLREERIRIWGEMPREVAALPCSGRAIQPAGNVLYAEAMTREYTELLWQFLDGWHKGLMDEASFRSAAGLMLNHLAERLDGSHDLPRAATVIREAG